MSGVQEIFTPSAKIDFVDGKLVFKDDGTALACDICPFQCESPMRMSFHFCASHLFLFQCKVCRIKMDAHSDMVEHIFARHLSEEMQDMLQRDGIPNLDKFPGSAAVQSNNAQVSPDRRRSVRIRRDLLEDKMSELSNEKDHEISGRIGTTENQCYICGKVFTTKQGWKRHEANITTDPVTKRPMCVGRGKRKSILAVSKLSTGKSFLTWYKHAPVHFSLLLLPWIKLWTKLRSMTDWIEL